LGSSRIFGSWTRGYETKSLSTSVEERASTNIRNRFIGGVKRHR
jgi:hypothetical protein